LPSRFFAEGFPGCPFSKHLVGPVFVFAGFSDSALKQSLLKPNVLLTPHVSVSSIAPQAQMNAVLFRDKRRFCGGGSRLIYRSTAVCLTFGKGPCNGPKD